jgi:PKD repeat protein
MGTNNGLKYFFPRQGSKPYERVKNYTFDMNRRPFISLTINSLKYSGKAVKAEVHIDTDDNGGYDAFLNFPLYVTKGNTDDGTQEEEYYNAEGFWEGGVSPATIKGRIKLVVLHTNPNYEDLILYCGFDYKISWLALPYNHKDLIPVANAGIPNPLEPEKRVFVNDKVEFNGNNSYDPNDDLNGNGKIEPWLAENDNLKYKWDFGDGTQTTFSVMNRQIWHIYSRDSIPSGLECKQFDVHLWVQDPEGHVDDDWTQVTVFRGNHTPDIGSFKINGLEYHCKCEKELQTIAYFQEVWFEAKAMDLDEDELLYQWDLDGDDKFDKVGGEDTASSFKYSYHPGYIDDNFVIITLVVSDGTPETENDTVSYLIEVVENVQPVPTIFTRKEGDDKIYYDTIRIREDQKVIFYGSDSFDPDNLPGIYEEHGWISEMKMKFKWYFDYENDQSITSGWLDTSEIEYNYPVANAEMMYKVVLEVNDGLDSNRSTEFIVVVNLPPVPVARVMEDSYCINGQLNTDTPIYFDGSGSFDPNGDELDFAWHFGDPSPVSYEMNPVHIYETPGRFVVKLIVSDGDYLSAQFKLIVEIKEKPLPPTAIILISTLQTYTYTDIWFDASRSYDIDGYYYNLEDPMSYSKDIVRYYWDFGDGNYSTEFNTTHAYAREGVYQITLTIWDKSDIAATSSKYRVEILNRVPLADPGPNRIINAGDSIIFSGEDSEDPDGVVVRYLWDLGDGSEPAWTDEAQIQHTYTKPGKYYVTLQVRDNDGGVSEAESITVTVQSVESDTDLEDEILLIGLIAVIIIIIVVLAALIYIRTRSEI